jgi:SAM-dependent methyltransferase
VTLAQAKHQMMDVANGSNPCAGRFGAIYAYYMERDRLARPIARLVWGMDPRPLYDSIQELRSLPEGSLVVDVPCGSGLALRGLNPDQRIEYLGVDIDPRMLSRTARRAERDGLGQVTCARGDAERLPIADETADLCLSYNGLHCFARPTRALAEIVRCLRPGGKLRGTTFVSPGTRRQRLLFRAERRRTGLPALWTEGELLEALHEVGLSEITLGASAGYAFFRAEKPGESDR